MNGIIDEREREKDKYLVLEMIREWIYHMSIWTIQDLLVSEKVRPFPGPGDPQKLLTLSKNIDEAIGKSGVQLGEDETFVAVMFVAKRPKYVSDVIPFVHSGSDVLRANLILEPVIMEHVLKARERDRIKYSDDETEGK